MFQWGTCQMFSSRCFYTVGLQKTDYLENFNRKIPYHLVSYPFSGLNILSVLFPDTTCVLVRELQGNMSTGCLITVF